MVAPFLRFRFRGLRTQLKILIGTVGGLFEHWFVKFSAGTEIFRADGFKYSIKRLFTQLGGLLMSLARIVSFTLTRKGKPQIMPSCDIASMLFDELSQHFYGLFVATLLI